MTLGLFYPGRTNVINGASGDGKSWLTIAAIAERLTRNEPVELWDWEDHPDGIAHRLTNIRLTPTQLHHLAYRNPATGIHSLNAAAAWTRAANRNPTLVIIDSVGEAMAASGIDPNSDGEVATWMAHIKQITRWPSHPAVILVDHIPKDPENKSLGGIGSQRKLAAITGASYRVRQITAFSQTRPGKLKLTVEKDRIGNRPKGSVAAIIDFTPTGDGRLDIAVHAGDQPGLTAGEEDRPFRHTVYMERVSRWLELYPGATGRDIEQSVDGRGTLIRAGLNELIEDGHVTVTSGPRGAHLHTVTTPYRDTITPDDPTASHRVPTASHRVPDAVTPAVATASTASPPYKGDADADAVNPAQSHFSPTTASGDADAVDLI